MRTEFVRLRQGEPSRGFTKQFARVVYDRCEIFKHRNFDEYFFNLSRTAMSLPRWEYVVYDDEDSVIASMAFFEEFDMHVGDCLSVLLALSTDPKYLIGGYRKLFQTAKEEMVPFVCYTKETKPFHYEMVYRRING